MVVLGALAGVDVVVRVCVAVAVAVRAAELGSASLVEVPVVVAAARTTSLEAVLPPPQAQHAVAAEKPPVAYVSKVPMAALQPAPKPPEAVQA